MSWRVLFIDSVHPCLEEMLTKAGVICEHDYTCSKAQLIDKIPAYQGLVIRSRLAIDQSVLGAASALKFIARAGAGMENIDVAYANQQGIELFNAPEANRDAVGEQAVGMLLMLFNHLKRVDQQVREGIWLRAENRGTEIKEKVVGIIGFGQMGSAFAEKLSGFGCTILAHDKYKDSIAEKYVRLVSLEELQAKADIISLHLPLTPETHYYIAEDFINNCAKPFYLLNTARGKNLNTNALVQGLKSGKIKGACLDVLEYEKSSFENLNAADLPAEFKYLIDSENVILSPHIAGWTIESHEKLSSVLGNKILHYFNTPNKPIS